MKLFLLAAPSQAPVFLELGGKVNHMLPPIHKGEPRPAPHLLGYTLACVFQ